MNVVIIERNSKSRISQVLCGLSELYIWFIVCYVENVLACTVMLL